jgi:hypothetical protein
METKQGTLIRRQGIALPVTYTAHSAGFSGEPAYFELHGLTVDLDEDEVVVLSNGSGRGYTCRVLDSTNICAVITPRD